MYFTAKKITEDKVNLPRRHNSKCVGKNRASKYMEQKLIGMRGEIDKFTIIVRDYSSFLSASSNTIDRKQKGL